MWSLTIYPGPLGLTWPAEHCFSWVMWLLTTPVSGCVKMFRALTVACSGTRYTMVSTWCPPPPGPCLTDGHIMVAANRDNYHHKTPTSPLTQGHKIEIILSVIHSAASMINYMLSTSPHPITGDNSPRLPNIPSCPMFVCVPHLTLCLSLNIWFNLTSNPSPAVWPGPGLGDMTTSQYCL